MSVLNERQSPSTDSGNETDKNTKKDVTQTEIKVLTDFKHKYRNSLPDSMVDRSKFSLWSILKQCVDRELYKFNLPIVWNEPLSLLQRAAENIRYADQLLDKAASSTNACDRMKYMAAFLISSTSIHIQRLSKPFNPLLGETYEYVCNDKNFRIICEQVSHHPPISAYYSESILPTKDEKTVKWKYYGSVNPVMKINFLHACAEAFPEGIQTVELPEYDEVYTWNNLKVTAHNIVLGKMWLEYTGQVEIVNHKLNMKCVLEYKPYSWFSKQLNRVEGYIVDANGEKISILNGKWDEYVCATDMVDKSAEFYKKTQSLEKISSMKKSSSSSSFQISDVDLIWTTEDSKLHSDLYNFSDFTLRLNEMHPNLKEPSQILIPEEELNVTKIVTLGPLPITDSRYRPDLKLFENGDLDDATSEKHRLEEKQREARRKFNQDDNNWKPLWFEKKNHSIVDSEETYTFNHKYWERDFSDCPNLY